MTFLVDLFMSLNPIYVKSINSRPMTHQHCLMDSLIVTIMWDAFYKVWSKWIAFKKLTNLWIHILLVNVIGSNEKNQMQI